MIAIISKTVELAVRWRREGAYEQIHRRDTSKADKTFPYRWAASSFPQGVHFFQTSPVEVSGAVEHHQSSQEKSAYRILRDAFPVHIYSVENMIPAGLFDGTKPMKTTPMTKVGMAIMAENPRRCQWKRVRLSLA
jgi:hypothetical protein